MKHNTTFLPLLGHKIILGVTGSIASYKSAYLASALSKLGAEVFVVMTPSATKFIGLETFEGLTHNPVISNLWDNKTKSNIDHVDIGLEASCMVIAPATANTIAKIAYGVADNPVTATALSSRANLLIAPAMDGEMYEKSSTKKNIEVLTNTGIHFVGPIHGRLASGITGNGRLAEIDEIVDNVRKIIGLSGDFKGKKVVVTAGGTREPIDPVRYITNRSSGLMGHSIAEAARDRGANVTLITSSQILNVPFGMEVIKTSTVESVRLNVLKNCANADLLVMAAAISDYRPTVISNEKIKKDKNQFILELKKIEDWLGEIKNSDLVKIVFAAETSDTLKNAKEKLSNKDAPFIVANNVLEKDSGFENYTNHVSFVWKDGKVEDLPTLPKFNVAHEILNRSIKLL